MKKRMLSFAQALLLCQGLAVPALAADTSAITWLQLQGTPRYYIKELDWLVLSGDDGGIVDLATGKQVMDYDYIYPFVNGLAEVVKYTEDGRQQHGFIGTDGTVVIPLEYEEIGTKVIDIDDNWALVGDDFSEPLIIAAKYNPSLTSADVKDWCIIDSTGNPLMIVALLAVLGAGGAVAYLKFFKKKPSVKGSADLDDYDYGADDDLDDDWDNDPEEDSQDDEPEEG